MKCVTLITLAAVLQLALVRISQATVTATHNFRPWSSAAGSFTTLDFTGFAPDTIITTQYQPLGAVFTDAGGSVDYAVGPRTTGFPLDGWGVSGGLNDEIHISFSAPQYSFATHFPGAIQYWLYNSGEIIYQSPRFFSSPHPGEFAGLLSTQPFDSVMLLDPFLPGVAADNIYFASGIPAPGGLALLISTTLCSRRRRRC